MEKTISKERLENILKLHRKWLYGEEGGERAELRGANLRGTDLSGAALAQADLHLVDLDDVDLSSADLHGADLYGANMARANLRDAYLAGSILSSACLTGTDLSRACLRGSELSSANLRMADLSYADLIDARLSHASFVGANLFHARTDDADLIGASLSGAINVPAITAARLSIVPEEGSFIGWKKANNYEHPSLSGSCPVIVKLLIPEDAKRSNATGRKCRASKAVVLGIEHLDGGYSELDVAYSSHDGGFAYRVGETVEPTKPFDEDRWKECAPGIHFFITRAEAVAY